MTPIVLGAALLAVVAACKSKNPDKDVAPAPAPAPPAAPAPAPAADKPYQMHQEAADLQRAEGQYKMKGPHTLEWKKLDAMGLQLEMPANAEYRDIGDHDAPGAQYATPDASCSPRINQADAKVTTDFDKAKAEIAKIAKSGKITWTKAAKTGDDWTLVYSYVEPEAPHDTELGVHELRKIGAHTYECWDESTTPEGGVCGVHACDSLKAL